MIKDVIIHLHGRQPLLVDLRGLPGPGEAMLLAHNVRMRDGKRPSFVEVPDSWFLIPVHEISIIELPRAAVDGQALPPSPLERPAVAGPVDPDELPADEHGSGPLEPDEDLLARIRGI